MNPESSADAAIPATRRLYWAVRRELWENRSIYLAPLAVAALILVGFLISTISLPGKIRAASALSPMQQHNLIAEPYLIAAGLMMLTTLAVGVFYSLDALYGERRDRSILFWKSLPVSDLTTVLSKAITPVVILPLVTFAITAMVQWIMLLVSSLVLLGNGVSAAPIWTHASLFEKWLMLLYHFITIHGLWYAPIYGWLLLVSAWARRAPFLWAGLPPLGGRGREDCVQHLAFRHDGGYAHDWWRGRRRGVHDGLYFDGSADALQSGRVPDESRSVDRPGSRGGIPRRGGPAAPLSRPYLSRIVLFRRDRSASTEWVISPQTVWSSFHVADEPTSYRPEIRAAGRRLSPVRNRQDVDSREKCFVTYRFPRQSRSRQ